MVFQLFVRFQRTQCYVFNGVPELSELISSIKDREFFGSGDVDFYLSSGGRVLTNARVTSGVIDVNLRLKGGKGGFGAMLRSQGKGAGNKPTTDFGSCRDLSGRRLRHVNQELAMHKWQSEKTQREQQKHMDPRAIENERTPSGIDGWYLNTPSWAEGLKKAGSRSRRKTVMCNSWVQARRDRPAPIGAPRWWGCPRGRQCDYAHGEMELRGENLTAYKNEEDEKRKRKQEAEVQDYISCKVNVQDEVANAFQKGILRQQAKKKQKLQESLTEENLVLPLDACTTGTNGKSPGSRYVTPLFGSVAITTDGEVEGVSDFGTASVYGCYLQTGKWYYEVTLLTAGVMQIGWSDHNFEGNSDSGDGVGDHVHSWAFDGVRKLKWNGESQPYGDVWCVGDVIGCFLDIDEGCISFSKNGKSMGIAFQHNIVLSKISKNCREGFFPAFSLEEGEAIHVNLGEEKFQYFGLNQDSFTAVIKALKSPLCTAKLAEDMNDNSVSKTVEATIQSDKKTEVTLEVTKNNVPPMDSNVSVVKKKNQKNIATNITPVPLDLRKINSITDLELLGMDRLKSALMAAGIKCGGTLEQRATRLFSIKGKCFEDIDDSIKAKPKNNLQKR